MQIRQAYRLATERLEPLYGAREAASVAEWLLGGKYGADRLRRVAEPEALLSTSRAEEFREDLRRLEQWEPVQYVVGWTEFLGRRFGVTPDTLIPRPETEELVQHVIRDFGEIADRARIVDVGTGSGAIAVSLALELPGARVEAWDVSAGALAVARRNAEQLGAQVEFFEKNVLQASDGTPFDLVVSNPPYIPEDERGAMRRNVLEFEPPGALFVPDHDPLRFYRAIVERIPAGAVWLEVHERYGEQVKSLLQAHGFARAAVLRDFREKDRFVYGIR